MLRFLVTRITAALHCARTAGVATSLPRRVADVQPALYRSSRAEPTPRRIRCAFRRTRNRANVRRSGRGLSPRAPLRPLRRMLRADLRRLARNSDYLQTVSYPSLHRVRVTTQFTHCAIVISPVTHVSLPPPRSMRIRSCSATASSQYDNSAKSIPASSPTENPDWTSPAKLAAAGARNFRRSPQPATPSRRQAPSPARPRTRSCTRRSASAPRSVRKPLRSRHHRPPPAERAADRARRPCGLLLAHPMAARLSSCLHLPSPPRRRFSLRSPSLPRSSSLNAPASVSRAVSIIL